MITTTENTHCIPAERVAFTTQPLRTVVRWLATWRQRRLAIEHMETLDEHLLKDIGIKRAEIIAVVNGSRKSRSRDK